MRKPLFILLTTLGALAAVWIGVFYWRNLRGVGPAVREPSQDIAQLLPEARPTPRKQASSPAPPQNTTNLPLKLPDGFSISIFAKGLGAPRVLLRDPSGTLLVSIPGDGRVVALPDRNTDGVADETITILSGLNRPHGLAARCTSSCQLYVAETDQVAAYDYDSTMLKAQNKKTIARLPGGGNHFSRTLLFLPPPNNDTLLVSVGSSCNVCNERDERRAKILVVNADGSNLRTFASGLRNAVFMTLHPETKKVWTTEMGRDLLGDEIPPDEINIVEDGKDYGWPLCYGKNVHDTAFDTRAAKNPCVEPGKTPSLIDLPAHSAPLGLTFVPDEGWPAEYRGNLFLAYHGSWNRSVPTGYKIVRFRFDAAGRALEQGDLIGGWLQNDGTALGRPVDLLAEPGGTLFISDDKAGVIYRVTAHN
ncbi:MAG: PQQ-dependent sugar dehydrogenase [bacterium]|nr:PQQ-dependent sugar dehydrogenase [bacterium]